MPKKQPQAVEEPVAAGVGTLRASGNPVGVGVSDVSGGVAQCGRLPSTIEVKSNARPGPNHAKPRRYGRQALRTRYARSSGMIAGLVASGHGFSEFLAAYPYLAPYPYLEDEDIRQALEYGAWRVEEIEVPLPAA
jgi:uncharacterized protein (DUF433 family)